eukprot:2118259-Pleurochrysis_carterae.AAC.1
MTERTRTGRRSKHNRETHRIHTFAARAAASGLAELLQVDALAASEATIVLVTKAAKVMMRDDAGESM